MFVWKNTKFVSKLLIVLVALNGPTVLSKVSSCGHIHLVEVQGTISSPDYPLRYKPNLECNWTITTPNPKSIISIRLWDLDIYNRLGSPHNKDSIEENSPPLHEPPHQHLHTSCTIGSDDDNKSSGSCCPNSWLRIGDQKFCGNLTKSTVITFAASSLQISFVTGGVTEGQQNYGDGAGFMAIYSVRSAVRCSNNNTTLMCLDRKRCYRHEEICDSVFQCADHSDEMNCGQCEDSLTRCNIYSSFCFDPKFQRCNGVRECPRGEDEANCSAAEKNANLTAKKSFRQPQSGRINVLQQEENEDAESNDFFWIGVMLLGVAFIYLTIRWCIYRRDARSMINHPPEFPLPPFRGPSDAASGHNAPDFTEEFPEGETRRRFSEADFLQGGEIYEAFVRARRNIDEDRKDVRRSLRRRNRCFDSNLDPDDVDDLIFGRESFMSAAPFIGVSRTNDLFSGICSTDGRRRDNDDGDDDDDDPSSDKSSVSDDDEKSVNLPTELFQERNFVDESLTVGICKGSGDEEKRALEEIVVQESAKCSCPALQFGSDFNFPI